jgi:hypothetical protein
MFYNNLESFYTSNTPINFIIIFIAKLKFIENNDSHHSLIFSNILSVINHQLNQHKIYRINQNDYKLNN